MIQGYGGFLGKAFPMDGGADESSILTSAKHPDERQRILADIFMGHRDRLGSMVRFRLDRRLRARVDPSDILQDAFLEASGRIAEYLVSFRGRSSDSPPPISPADCPWGILLDPRGRVGEKSVRDEDRASSLVLGARFHKVKMR